MDADGFRQIFREIRDGGSVERLVEEVRIGGMEAWNEAVIGVELARLERAEGLELFDEVYFRRTLIDAVLSGARRAGTYDEVLESIPIRWRINHLRRLSAAERRAILIASDGPRRITEDIDRLQMEYSEDVNMVLGQEFDRMRRAIAERRAYDGFRAWVYNNAISSPRFAICMMWIRHQILLALYWVYLILEMDRIAAFYCMGILAWVHPVVVLATLKEPLKAAWRYKKEAILILLVSIMYYVDDFTPYVAIERIIGVLNKILVSVGDSAIRSYFANEINAFRMLISIYIAPMLRFVGYEYETPAQSVVAVIRGILSLLSMTAPYVLIVKEVLAIRSLGGNTMLALANRVFNREAIFEPGFHWGNEMIHMGLGLMTSGPWYLLRWGGGKYLSFAPLIIAILRIMPLSTLMLWGLYPLIPLMACCYIYEVRGWCYLNAANSDLERRRMLKSMGYRPLITAARFTQYLVSYPRAARAFTVSKIGEYFHIEAAGGGVDMDSMYEMLLAEPARKVGSAMGNWRMTRRDQNPLASLHTRVKNTAEGIIRSKGLTPMAGLIARSTEFSYTHPLKHRISGINRIQEQAIVNTMMQRNMVAKEDAVGLEVKAPYIKTGLDLNSKAAKMISERTGTVLVSDPEVMGPHEAAVVLRTKFLIGVSERETNSGVGMIIFAPSVLEMHMFPLAVWLFVEGADGFDVERADGGCSCPAAKVCEVRAAAAQDGRWLVDRDWKSKQVRHAVSKYGVQVGVMTHIEPNVSPREILDMQVVLGVQKIYSLFNFAMRPIFGESAVDTITGHTFVRTGNQIVCGFDSGTYTHDVRNFEKICEVVENGKGQWQKREIIWEVERTIASVLHVNTGSRGGIASAYRPGMHTSYVLPTPSITGIRYVIVRRAAMDNLLGRLVTKVKITIEDIMQAIRGSSVTLTISGASVQPRFDQSWDECRAIANFVYIYLNAKNIAKTCVESARENETILTWATKASHLLYEQIASVYGGEVPNLSVTEVQEVLVNICSKSRQLPLGTISEICTRRFFGPATKKVKAVQTPASQFHSMHDLVNMYRQGHDANLSSTLDLTLKISKRWLAENVSIVAEGAVLAQTAWSGLWSFAEEIFRRNADEVNAEKCRLLRQKFDWTKYNAPEIIRALLECVVGDSLSFLSAAKHLVATVIGAYSEANRLNIVQQEIVATAETVQRYREAAAAQPAEEQTERNVRLWYQELYEIYADEAPTAIELFNDNFFPLGNDAAAMMRSYNQVLDKFLDYRRNMLGDRTIPYQDVFHSVVTIFGSMRGVANRAKLIDSVIAKVASDVGLEMAPVLRELTRKVEEKAAENLEQARVELRAYAENEKCMETEMGDRLPLRKVEINVMDQVGDRVDLEAAERHDGPTVLRARDGRLMRVFRHSEKGILTDDELERMAGAEAIAWSRGPGGPSRERTNAFVGSTQIGARMFEEFDRLVSGRREASTLTEVYDENMFDVEMEDFIHNPDFGNLADDVNRFTQYQTAAPATYVAHLRGLPASMKSAFMRKHLDHRDIVVAPSKKLKLSWEKELADIPRDRRPRVLTQHTALLARSERFVVIDEVYTMGRQHVAALSKIAGRGLITLGDPSQIRVAFNHGRLFDFEHLATYRFQSMLSFIPFDALLVYLNNADLALYDLDIPFISVCSPLRGLKNVQTMDVILNGDMHITMNQDGAAMRRGRGQLNTRTAHEVQGSRGKEAVVYMDAHQTNAFSNSLMHFGVAISRSTEYTVLVTQRGVNYGNIPGIEITRVNGGPMKHYSQYDPAGYLLQAGLGGDEVDVEEEKDYAEREWKEERFEEEMFDEAIEPASLLVDGVAISTDDFTHETKFEYPVDKCVRKISADWVYEKVKSEIEPSYLIKGGKMNVLHNHLQRAKEKEKVKASHRQNARKLADRFAENGLLDMEKFGQLYKLAGHIHYYHQKRPEQLRSYLQATGERKAELFATAFAKNAYAKKTAEGKMKFQGVISSNKVIQGLFARMVFMLTFAFKYSLREGADIDVGMDDEELFSKIARIQSQLRGGNLGFMMDLELQDSTHNPNHIATMSELLRRAGEDEELIKAFEHVREGEEIVDIHGQFVLSSAVSLSSGAPWTLISNILMMFTSVLNEYEIPGNVLFLQKGDDLTASRAFPRRCKITDLKVVWKIDRSRYADFTSKAAIYQFRIRKNMRLFLSAAFDRRTRIKHEAWGKELRNFLYEIEAIGFDEWVRLRFEIFSIDPTGAEDVVRKAIRITRMPYDELPEKYKQGDSKVRPKRVMISEKEKCAYHAMSHLVSAEDLGYLRDQLYYDDVDWELIRGVANRLNVRVVFHSGRYPGDNGVEPVEKDMGLLQVWNDHAMVWLTAEQYVKSMETKSEKDDRERGEKMDFDF